jgi:hypothetical protein
VRCTCLLLTQSGRYAKVMPLGAMAIGYDALHATNFARAFFHPIARRGIVLAEAVLTQ